MSFENGEHDDMDGYDWINWIDEYHCTDYWYSDDGDPDEDLEDFEEDGDED